MEIHVYVSHRLIISFVFSVMILVVTTMSVPKRKRQILFLQTNVVNLFVALLYPVYSFAVPVFYCLLSHKMQVDRPTENDEGSRILSFALVMTLYHMLMVINM